MTNVKLAYVLEVPISSWVKYELRALRKVGVDPLICTVNKKGEKELEEFKYLKTSKLKFLYAIFYFLLKNPSKTMALYFPWRKEIGSRMFLRTLYLAHELGQRGITLLHAHFIAGAGTVAFLINEYVRIPHIITIHAYDLFKGNINDNKLMLKLHRASRIRSVSHNNIEYLKKKLKNLPIDKFFVTHCGIDLEKFRPIGKKDHGNFKILSIANLVEKKGHIYLLKACKILQERKLNFQCTVVGDGELRGKLERFVKSNGLQEVVSLAGKCPNETINDFYRDSSVFVLPCIVASDGDRDGIPVSLMESMACGVPVVSTYISGIPELIKDRENGLLVPPKDESSLADAIELIYSSRDLSQSLSEKARETIQDDFNIEKIALELKENLLGIRQ